MSRKAFTVAVVAATIAWSIGLSALVAPLAVRAASSGDLVRGSLPAVYYVGADGKRYVFPNEKTYSTWYSDFSGVTTITDAELASMPIGGNVTYKPGALMVKIQSDPKVYAVDAHGTLRAIPDEACAAHLYGADWNQHIHDVPDAFFVNYSVGADLSGSPCAFDVAGVSAAATSINSDKNLSTGSTAAGVSVMNPGQPVASTIPKGATGVNFVKFDVKNSSSSATALSSVTVHRDGPGASTDFSNVYVYNGSERLTTGRSINSSTNEATFSGLNLSIAAGGTAHLWIAADMASSAAGAGNVNALSVTSVMVGGNNAAGTPIMGPSFTLATATVGTTTINKTGTLSNVKAGGSQQKVAEFYITAPSAEDADVKSIALFYSGTTNRSEITNLTLKQAGLTLATTPSLTDKDLAVFQLTSPMYMEKGAQRTFEVYADIGAGAGRTSSETVGFYLDQSTDLMVNGRTYGFGTIISNSWTTANTATVEAGKLTTTFNGPAAKNIPQNGKDVELFNVTMAAQSTLEIRQTDFQVTVAAAGDCDKIDDFKLVDVATGAIVAGPVDLSQGTDADTLCESSSSNGSDVISFTETWNMNAGESRTLKVTADIASTFTADNTVKVTLGNGTNIFTANKVRNLDNSSYLSTSSGDFVPATPIVGNSHTVKEVSLTTSAASTPVAQTYIQGTSGAALGAIALKAGDAGDVKVTTVKFTGYVDADGDGADSHDGQQGYDGAGNTVAALAPTLKLWNGSTQLGSTETPTSSASAGTGGVVTFDNLNLTIPAGQTVTLNLTGDLAGGLSGLADDLFFNIDSATDITASDVDGTTVTPTGTTQGPEMKIAASGTLSFALAPNDTDTEAGIVVGGTSNAVLAKYKFTALNEELKLTKARFSIASASAAGATSLSVYDGSTLVGGPVAVDGSGNADFSGMNFVIPKDGSKTLTVKGNLNSVGSSGAATGLDLKVTLHDGDTVSGDDGTFEARGTGAGSSTIITATDSTDDNTDPSANVANSKILRKTKPTVSLVSLPSSTLTTGDLVSMRFTISADAAESVAVKHLSVSIAKTGGAADGSGTDPVIAVTSASSVRRVGDSSNIAGSAALVSTDGDTTGSDTATNCGEIDTACTVNIAFTNEEVIAAGTSRTYDVRLNVSGSLATGDSISASLLGDTDGDSGAITDGSASVVKVGGDATSFTWSDNSTTSHSDTLGSSSSDWADGLYVKVLPTDTQVMTK